MNARGFFRGTIAAVLMGIGVAAAGLDVTSGIAAETAMPAHAVLVVDGNVARPASFDLEALKSLPRTSVKTMTPWTDGEDVYEGIRIRDLLDRLGAKGKTLLADAIDDYQVTIPMEDVRDYDVIVAYAMNGKPLPLDDKGPLWIIYPYSGHSRLQKDLYFSRSVWQLNRLTVR